MEISKITVWRFEPSFRDGPYEMSYVTQSKIDGYILRFETTSGLNGVGEIVFPPKIPIETRRRRMMQLHDILPRLLGKNYNSLMVLANDLHNRDRSWSGVSFCLETCFFDLQGKLKKQSCSELLGGALNRSVNDYLSISERNRTGIRNRISLVGSGHAVIQLKLGIGTRDDDVDHITAALDCMTETQVLLADANGGWTVDQACEIISLFDDKRLIWEEPSSTYEHNADVAARTGRHVMVDQCVGHAPIAMKAVSEQIVSSVCIKPAFLGGLTIGRQVMRACVSTGMQMRIDGPICGDIASAANLHLAVCAPPELLIASCDLREPLVIDTDLQGVLRLEANRIAPPSGFGLGITVPQDGFGTAEADYH